MPDRKDAGVPAKTAFSKDVEGPQRILGDGIAGGPVAVHCFAGKVFKKGFGTPGFLPEGFRDRKSTRLNSSHVRISYAVFCLKKKKKKTKINTVDRKKINQGRNRNR